MASRYCVRFDLHAAYVVTSRVEYSGYEMPYLNEISQSTSQKQAFSVVISSYHCGWGMATPQCLGCASSRSRCWRGTALMKHVIPSTPGNLSTHTVVSAAYDVVRHAHGRRGSSGGRRRSPTVKRLIFKKQLLSAFIFEDKICSFIHSECYESPNYVTEGLRRYCS